MTATGGRPELWVFLVRLGPTEGATDSALEDIDELKDTEDMAQKEMEKIKGEKSLRKSSDDANGQIKASAMSDWGRWVCVRIYRRDADRGELRGGACFGGRSH